MIDASYCGTPGSIRVKSDVMVTASRSSATTVNVHVSRANDRSPAGAVPVEEEFEA
jgi:hypothetical protein